MTQNRRRKPVQIALIALPRQAVAERVRVRRRETIRNFVDRTGWERRGLPIVAARMVKGELQPIMRSEWSQRITRREEILFISMPRGGGGRSIGALLAMIALMVVANIVAPGIGGAIAGAVGFGSAATWTAITSAIIIAGGSLLISHFLKPPSGAKSEDDVFSVSLSGNRARPQQPIPVQYGRLKFNPDFAAPPWADYQGTTQLFHGLYCLGVGEFEVEEIGIHDTPVWTAAGGFSGSFPNFKYEIVPPGQPVTLFPANVAVSPDLTGQQIPVPYSADNPGPSGETSGLSYLGPFIINGPGTVGQTVSVDIVFPSGCYFILSNGRQVVSGNTTLCEYRYVDDVGVATSDWATLFNKTYRFNTTAPVRLTETVDLPSAGRVQLRIANTEPPTPTAQNSVAGARIYIHGPETVTNVTRLAIQLVADRQLSQFSSQQIYAIATRKIDAYDYGNAIWSFQATSNPFWAAVDMWSNTLYGAGQSRSKIDLERIFYQAVQADARGDTFNYRFTQTMTVAEAMDTILRGSLSAPVFVWDNFSVVRDEPRTPELLLTDLEIIRGTVELNYPLADAQTADGAIVEYLEEQTWKRADVASTDTLAELIQPARVQVPGVTKRAQATLVARYLAAVNNYRRETLSCEVEADGKLVRRGSQVIVSTEMPETWGESVRIESYDSGSRTMTFHAPVDWSGAGPWYIRVRRANGMPWGPVQVTQGAAPNIAVVSSSDLATVQTQQGIALTDALARSSTEENATGAFSAASPKEFVGLVSAISNSGEGRFHLTLVVDAPEVYDINANDVPVVPLLPPLILPGAPGAVTGIHATLTQVGTGLQLSASWIPDPIASTYTAKISLDTRASFQTVYSGGSSDFITAGLIPLVSSPILLQIRGESATGIAGPWTEVSLDPADIVINGTIVTLEVDFEDTVKEARHQLELVSQMGAGSIYELNQKIDALTEQIASASATQAAHDFQERKLIKVTYGQGIKQNYAAILTEQTARVSEDEALASVQTTLQARLTTAEGNITGQATTISSLSSSVTTQGGQITSLSTSYTGLNSRLTTAEGNIAGTASSVTSLTSTVTSLNGTVSANSSSLSSLSTTVGSHTSSITTLTSSVDGISSQWALAMTIDGSTGGLVANGVKHAGGGTTFQFVFANADVFVDGTFTARKLIDLSVDTGKLANNAITTGTSGTGTGVAYAGLSIIPDQAYVMATCTLNDMFRTLYAGSTGSGWSIGFYINGLPVQRRQLGFFTETTTSGATSSLDYFQQSAVFTWKNEYGHDLTSCTLECRIEQTGTSGAIWQGSQACSVSALLFKK